MATEAADVLEPVSLMERAVDRHLNPGEFDHPPETADCLVKSGHMEVSSEVEVATVHSSFEANAGTKGGVIFFEAPSITKVPEEETIETQETYQAEKLPCQAEKEMLEYDKQTRKDKNFKTAEETGSKGSEVSREIEEVAAKKERSNEVSDATGINLKIDNIDEEKTSWEDKIIDCVESDEQVLVEENPKGIDKESLLSDSQKAEKGGRKEEEDVELKTSKLDASLAPNEEVLVHTSENLGSNVETQTNACPDNEDKGPNMVQLIEKMANDKEGTRNDETGETSSTVTTSLDIQNDGEASPATDKSSTQEAGVEAVDKVEENCSMAGQVESGDIKGNDMIPLVDETEESSQVEIPSVSQNDEMRLQQVDKTEIAKPVAETFLEDVVKRSQEEECQTEIAEKTPEAESSGAEEVMDEKNSEQKLDDFFMKHEEIKKNNQEEQAVSEALNEEGRDKDGHTIVADQDNISDAVTVLEHSKNEAENEMIQISLEMVSEEIQCQTEMVKKTPEAEISGAEEVEEKNLEQKLDHLLMKDDDIKQNIDVFEALEEQSRDKSGYTVVADEDKISDAATVAEHNKDRPEIEKIQKSLEMVPEQIQCATEIVKKTPEAESSGAEESFDSLFMRHEDVKQKIDEEQAVSEALTAEIRDKSMHTVVADQDNISDAVTFQDHSKDERENEKLQTPSEMPSEEIQCQIETIEKAPEFQSSGAEVKDEKNPEQKLDSLLMKHEDIKQIIDEEHAVSEAIEEQSRDKSGYTVVADEDQISDAATVAEHNKDRPEIEKIQTSLEMVPEEIKCATEMVEKTPKAESSGAEEVKDEKNPEQSFDHLFMKHGDIKQNIDEEQAVSEALATEIRDKSMHIVMADQDNINDAVTIQDYSKDEPENEKLQTPFEMPSEEIQCQTETIEKAPEFQSSGAKEVKDEKNPEQKLDSLLMKHEDVKQNIDEEQAVSEALGEESRDKSEIAAVADEDNISDAVIVPEYSMDEPENKRIQTSLEMPSEDIHRTDSREWSEAITCAKEDTSVINQDESFDKLEKQESSVDNEAVEVDAISKVEDFLPTELHDKGETSEVEILNEEKLNVIHAVEKETVVVEDSEMSKVSNFEPEDQIYETNGAAMDEEKPDDNDSQACRSTTNPSLELPSEKGTVTTDLNSKKNETEIKISEELHKSDSSPYKGDDTEKCHAEEATSDKVGSTAFLQEAIEQNVQEASVQDAASPLNDEVDKNEKARSIINEEVTGIGEVHDEPNISDSVMHISSEVINEEAVECSQLTEKEVEAPKEEDTEGISQESVEEGKAKDIQDDDGKDAGKSSSREIFEESETPKTVDIANETKKSDENPDSTLQYSLVEEQENPQSQSITEEQTSLAEQIDGGCPIKKDEAKENNTRLEEAGENNEVILKGEEDSEHILQMNETKENIEQSSNVISAATEPGALSQTADNTVEGGETEKEEITYESKLKSPSQENEAQEPANNFQKDENSAETSNEEIFEDSKAEGTGDRYDETSLNDKSTNETIPTPLPDRTATSESSEIRACAKDDKAIKNEEESFHKMEAEEKSIDIDPNRDDDIQKLENLPTTELNEKIEIAEVEISKRNVDKLNETFTQEQDLGEVSHFKTQDQVQKEEVVRDEEKHDENDSQACERTQNTNSQHPFEEGAETPEPSPETSEADAKKLEMVQGIDSEEKIKTTHAEMTIEEDIQKKEEVYETEMQEFATSDDNGKCHTEEVNSDKFCSSAFLLETVEQNSQATNLHEAPTTLNDEAEFLEKTKGCTSEEITGIGKVNDEQDKPDSIAHLSSEVINDETIESNQQTEKDAEEQIIGGNNVSGISQEPVEEYPVKSSENDENNTEEFSNRKIFEKSDTAETVDYTAAEAEQTDESPISVVEQKSQESENQTAVEASSVEAIKEDGSAVKKDEDRENDTGVAEIDERNEVILKGEEDLEQILQKNETKENIEQPLNVISTENEAGASSQTDDYGVENVVVESPQCSEREAEVEKDEEIVNESNIKSLSQEPVAQNPVKKFHNDDNNAEKSNSEIFEKSEVAETVDGIVTEAKESYESPDLVKEQENQQTQNLATPEASSVDKNGEDDENGEDGSLIKWDEEQEDDSGPAEVEDHNVTYAETKVVTSSQTDDNAGDDGVENPQCDERKLEITKDEELINESKAKCLSQETIEQDPVQNFQNDDSNTEKSSTQNLENSETDETVDGIVTEAKQSDERLDIANEQEGLQSQNLIIEKTSLVEEINEDESSIKKDKDGENETQNAEVHQHNEVILKGEEDTDQMLQKTETDDNIEQILNAMTAEIDAGALSQTDDIAVEDGGESPQCDERKVEKISKDEEIINESKAKSLSQESVSQNPVENFQNDDNNAEKSNTQILGNSETGERVDGIVTEAKQSDESPNPADEQERMPSQNVTIEEASLVDEIEEDKSSIKKDKDRENETQLAEVETHNEVTLKSEEDMNQILQIERSLNVMPTETEAGALSQIDDAAVEDGDERPQRNEKELEMEKDEESLSHEPVAEDPDKNFQNDDNNAEKSNTEIFEKSGTNETVDTIETKVSHSGESANLVEEHEIPQSQNLCIVEASSVQKIDEDESSIKKDEDNEKTELTETEEHNEVILKGKEDLEQEQIMQKDGCELEENIEQTLNEISEEKEAVASSQTDDTAVEDRVERPQCNEWEEEMEKDDVINESNVITLSRESVPEDPIKNFQNDDNSAENSNTEILEEAETAGIDEKVKHEINQINESSDATISAAVAKEVESLQDEDKSILEEDSMEKTIEIDGSSVKMNEEHDDNIRLEEDKKETPETVDHPTHVTIENNESLSSSLEASLAREQESAQSDDLAPAKASIMQVKDESVSSLKADEENSSTIELELKEQTEREALTGKQELQKVEPGENLEQSITVLSAEIEEGALSEAINNPEEETDESLKYSSKEAGIPEHIIIEKDIESLSKEAVKQGVVKNFQSEEHNVETSDKENFESVVSTTGEGIPLVMNQNDKSPDASHPIEPTKEEKTPQDKDINPAGVLTDEKKEDESSFKIIEGNDSENKLAEAIKNSEEISHNEENIILELQKNEPGELESSSDVIAAENQAVVLSEKTDDITIPTEVGAIQNTEETAEEGKKESCEKNPQPELQNNEPGELLESKQDVITSETKASLFSEMADGIEISGDVTAIQNTEETIEKEKKGEGNEDIDGNEVQKVLTTEDLKPAVETCNPSTSLDNETVEERSMISETGVETVEKAHGVETIENLEGTQMSKNTEEKMKGDNEELDASPSEDTEKHITMEEHTNTNISVESAGEGTAQIHGGKAEETPKMETHEELELTNIVEDREKRVLEEVNIEKVLPTETAIVTEDDVTEVRPKEGHEVIQSAENEDIAEQIIERGSIIKDSVEVPLTAIDAEGLQEKEKEDENDTVKSKEEIKESILNSVDNDAHDASNLVANRDHEIPAEAHEDEGGKKQEIKNKVLIAGNGDQNKIIISEIAPGKISDDNLTENSEMSSKVCELMTSEESKPIDENSTKGTTSNENTEIASISSQGVEPMHNENDIIAPEEVSERGFVDTGIQNANEKAGSYQSEDLNQDLGLHSEQNISKPEYAEILKTEETGDLVGQQEICKSKTSKDEDASNVGDEALKSTNLVNADRKEDVLEEDHSAKKSEASLKKDDAVEIAVAEKQEGDTTETNELPTEENIGLSDKSSKKTDCTSEIIKRDPSKEITLEMDPGQVEEDSISEAVELKCQELQESQLKTEEKTEQKFEAEDYIKETQNAEETMGAAILTEEVQKETEKADDGELVNQSNTEENDPNDLDTAFLADERVDEVRESISVSTEYLKATDLDEKTEIASSEVQETQTMGEETSHLEKKKEIEVEDKGVEKRLDLSTIAQTEDSKEVIKEQIIEDIKGYNEEKKTHVAEETIDYKLEELHTDDKQVELSNFPSDDSNLQAVEAEASQQESMALEETSSNFASQCPTDDRENIDRGDVPMKSVDIDDVVKSTKAFDVDHGSKFHDVEELHTGDIEDKIKEVSEMPTTDDHENVEQENVTMTSAEFDDIGESREISNVVYKSKFHDVEELHSSDIKDEIKEVSEMAHKSQGNETVARSEVAIDQTVPEGMTTASLAMTCKEEEHETKATIENLEGNIEELSTTKDDFSANSSAIKIKEDICSQYEKPRALEVPELNLEGKKDIPDNPNEECEEKGILNEIKDEIGEPSETVSKSNCHNLKAAIEDDVAANQILQEEKSEEQYQKESCALPSKEQELGSSTKVEQKEENIRGEELLEAEPKTSEDIYLQKYESRELQVSEIQLESPNAVQKEARGISVETEDKDDASESISESNVEGNGKLKGDEICSVQINPVEKSEEQNQQPSSIPISREQEDETSIKTESMEEKTKEVDVQVDKSKVEETSLQKEDEGIDGTKEEIKEVSELEEDETSVKTESMEEKTKEVEVQVDKSKVEETCLQKEDEGKDGMKEEIKEVSELVSKSGSLQNVVVAEYEFNSDHLLQTVKSEEQNQTSSAGFLSEEQEHGISIAAASIEEKIIRVEIPEGERSLIDEATLQKEELRELKPSQLEPQVDSDAQEKSLEDVHLTLQAEHENEKREDFLAEENQRKRTDDATELMHIEVTKEEIQEEKEDGKNCPAIATEESYPENQLKDEAMPGYNILAKEMIENEVLCEEIEKTSARDTTDKQISTEKGTVKNLPQAFVGNETMTEHFPNKTGGENGEDAGKQLNNENQDDEAISGDGGIVSTTVTEKVLGAETSQKESAMSLVEATDTTPGDISQEEKKSDGTLEKQAEPEAMISTIKKDVSQALQETIAETIQVTEVGGLQPANATNVDLEAKRHEEQKADNLISEKDGKTIEETATKDSAKISLLGMMQKSTRAWHVAAGETTGQQEPKTTKEETQTEEAQKKAKSDEEKEEEEDDEHEEAQDEHKKNNDSGTDAPVMVEASRDIDIKIAHKKSHNILSGVGSKVKHSIIKVKKAITGKSSHSKQHSPK